MLSMTTVLLAGAASASSPVVTQRIEPSTIALGDSAQLTISESGDGASPITPPMVQGLQFLAVGQSQRIESINGISHSTNSVTYQVTAQHTGNFKIPGPESGSGSLELTVSATPSNAASPAAGPSSSAVAGNALPAGTTHVTADGSAFVRLRLSTHQLYVGERIPVDIQVDTRDGVVAALNGVPSLNGDAFTLEPLSAHPIRTSEIVNGRPYTVFTWHSALEAVKPGDLSLSLETPLTVRVHSATARDSFFAGSGLDEFFNDPSLSNFFGGETQKEITVASPPSAFTVLALPTSGRPADFSGAVGHFAVSSDLSDKSAVAGDPITLRLHVSGSGNFDRVNAHMLQNPEHWSTYAPKATFTPADEVGYRGEKTFEQPVIARDSGQESLPALDFSWFDPQTRRYVSAQTAPLYVSIAPAPNSAPSFARNAPAVSAAVDATPSSVTPTTENGLRPDHVVTGSGPASLVPLSHRPAFLAIPSLMVLAFSGAFFWVGRRRDLSRFEDVGSSALLRYKSQLAEAAQSNDPERFFRAGRAALQQGMGRAWHVPPDAVTLETIEGRLGAHGIAADVFRLADEAAYSNSSLQPCDLKRWQTLIEHQLTEAVS